MRFFPSAAYAQFTPPNPTRRDKTVLSRRVVRQNFPDQLTDTYCRVRTGDLTRVFTAHCNKSRDRVDLLEKLRHHRKLRPALQRLAN